MNITEKQPGQGANMVDAFWISLSMHSVLPAPRREWRRESMSAAICFLPTVGIFVGGALALWQWFCLALNVETAVFASVAAVLPVILTGGLHMDGFMDTADAIGSHRSREEKLEIMKDSHAGAFAVLWCAVYLLLSFGVYSALYEKTALWLVGIIFVMSRALCSLSALTLPSARKGGLLHAFTEHAKNRAAVIVMAFVSAVCAAVMIASDQKIGLCCAAVAVAAFFAYRGMALKLFGGATGDTSGFFIQVCELSLLYGAFTGASL